MSSCQICLTYFHSAPRLTDAQLAKAPKPLLAGGTELSADFKKLYDQSRRQSGETRHPDQPFAAPETIVQKRSLEQSNLLWEDQSRQTLEAEKQQQKLSISSVARKQIVKLSILSNLLSFSAKVNR